VVVPFIEYSLMKESVGNIVGLQLVKQVVLNGGMYSTLLKP
jgi:hypothetical protein